MFQNRHCKYNIYLLPDQFCSLANNKLQVLNNYGVINFTSTRSLEATTVRQLRRILITKIILFAQPLSLFFSGEDCISMEVWSLFIFVV